MKEAQIRRAALSQIYIHGVMPCRWLYAETLNKSVHIFIKKWPWPCLLSSMAISAVSYGGYSSTEHVSTKENMNRGTLWSISRFRCESNYLEKIQKHWGDVEKRKGGNSISPSTALLLGCRVWSRSGFLFNFYIYSTVHHSKNKVSIRCPSVVEGTEKMWCIYSIKCQLIIKRMKSWYVQQHG